MKTHNLVTVQSIRHLSNFRITLCQKILERCFFIRDIDYWGPFIEYIEDIYLKIEK